MSSTKVVVSAVAIVAITFHFASEEKLGKKKKTKKKLTRTASFMVCGSSEKKICRRRPVLKKIAYFIQKDFFLKKNTGNHSLLSTKKIETKRKINKKVTEKVPSR